MFGWASPQPIPVRLEELLERAGALRSDWFERRSNDVLLFLPPHLLLSTGRLPHGAMVASYSMLDSTQNEPDTTEPPLLINGERLLCLSAEELANWQPHHPLPKPCTLESPQGLAAALTAALLTADPQLAEAYQALDARSERGGAAAELHYSARMGCHNPDELVQQWNQQMERSQAELDLRLLKQQLLDLETECERQFLSCREAERKLSWHRQVSQNTVVQLQRYGNLLQRLFLIQGRLL
jgi:hypothetical protein